jgi:hypothetical protein
MLVHEYTIAMDDGSSHNGEAQPEGARPEAIPISLLQSLDLANMNIPSYVCANQVVLTFPEKVRFGALEHAQPSTTWKHRLTASVCAHLHSAYAYHDAPRKERANVWRVASVAMGND